MNFTEKILEEFDENFASEIILDQEVRTVLPGLKLFLAESIQQAIAEERARVVGEIQNPYKEFNQEELSRVDTWSEWALLEHGKRMGFGRCKAEILSSLDKPLTDKE